MHVRVVIAALATLIGLGGPAQADLFAAGAVYGGPGSVGGHINCRIFNYGLRTASIPLTQIWTNTNVLVSLAFNS